MRLLFGIALLIGGLVLLWAARPKNGKPRFFVNTSLETPVVIGLVMAVGVGTVLTIGGIAELFR
jgi:hypothetical protein